MSERLKTAELDRLFGALEGAGYQVVGPTVQDGAIVYDHIRTAKDLPIGVTDEQGPGHYRLKTRDDGAAFGYVVGPHSWKKYLFPPRETLVQIRRGKEEPEWTATRDQGPALAFLGVRACELAAIEIQDKVFAGGPYVDHRYQVRRGRNLVVAVNCTEAGELCFCSSMNTGPRVGGEYDLRLTEIGDELLVEAGSDRGREVLDGLPTSSADAELEAAADEAIEACGQSMGRSLDTDGLPGRLMGNLGHPRWEELGERCLACGNCTAACPTCFCFNITDASDLTATEASRERSWDSCFMPEHSTIHGAQFRSDVESRYQQWITHKLATWTSQFGTSGCVGCGRCIAWCPVGIDITEEAEAIATGPGQPMVLPAPQKYEARGDDGQVPVAVRVRQVAVETEDTVTLVVDRPEGYDHGHGQFNMLSLPGVGDVPISISGSAEERIEHTVRSVGKTSAAITGLRTGSVLGLRGPFGSAWPLEKAQGRPVVVIAGGIGLAPLRSAVREMMHRPDDYPHVRLLYGTRSPKDILFDHELLGWIQSSRLRVHVTVDRCDSSWAGNIGVVTKLIRRKDTPADGLYFVCGPEVMMRFAVDALVQIDIPTENIFVSMERNMKCAVGHCGRCQYGPHFVCKDGPIFRYDHIADIFGKPGF